jgi:hypothetical protein
MGMPTTKLAMSDYVLTTCAELSDGCFRPAFSIVAPDGTELFAWTARFGFDTRPVALAYAGEYGRKDASVLIDSSTAANPAHASTAAGR